MVPVVQVFRASDCGSECRRFESDQAPTKSFAFAKLFLFIYTLPFEKEEQSEKEGME